MYGTVADSHRGTVASTTYRDAGSVLPRSSDSAIGREMRDSQLTYGLTASNNNRATCFQNCESIFVDLPTRTKLFGAFMLAVVVASSIVFSVMAANNGPPLHPKSNSTNTSTNTSTTTTTTVTPPIVTTASPSQPATTTLAPPSTTTTLAPPPTTAVPTTATPTPTFLIGTCSFYRDFRMWVASEAGCPAYGDTKPCTSDSECQLDTPAKCLYGSPSLLVCSPNTSKCALKTWSLPQTLDEPGSGVCPGSDLCGNTFPVGSVPNADLFTVYSMSPVECAAPSMCDQIPITCKPLDPPPSA